MSFSAIQKKIKKGDVRPLYLLYGTESFLMEEMIQTIINATLKVEEHDFNLSVYELKETPISVAIEEALTIPFMGVKRVVIVKDAVFLTGNKDQSKVPHDLKAFENYIGRPEPETVFVIIVPFEKLDERKKIVKLLKTNAEVIETNPLGEKEILNWIDERLGTYEVTMTNEAKDKLIQLHGNQLMMIAGEIQKLALYVEKGGEIEVDTVNLLVAKTVEQDIFALVDHVVHRRISEALHVFYDLLQQKEEPIKILALLARQFRIVYQVKELAKRGYGQQSIAGNLKLHPYVVKLAQQQGQKFSNRELFYILDQLAEADFKIKSGKMDKQLVLELFFTKVMTEKR